MSPAQDAAQIYQTQGYLNSIQILDQSQIAQHRAKFNDLEQQLGKEKCQIGLANLHLQHRFIWELTTHPKVMDIVQQVMGEDILVLGTRFFCKYPDGKRFVAWHQDITYWGLEPPVAHSVWIAIDDSDVGNGCMRVIPGSHRTGILDHGQSGRDDNLLSIDQEIPSESVDEDSAVDLELRAGQCSIHHGHLIHGSNPNTSGRRRCGLVVRFIPPQVRQVAANSTNVRWQPVLLRGEDRYNNFPQMAAPFPLA